MALLSQPIADMALEALARGPRTRAELQEELGASEASLRRLMDQLVVQGLVDEEIVRTPGRGRPSYRWTLAAADAYTRFAAACDEFRGALLERQQRELGRR